MKKITILLTILLSVFIFAPSVVLAAGPYDVAIEFVHVIFEGPGVQVLFTVSLSKPVEAGDQVTVDYATNDGTAIAGTDYTATSGTLTFNQPDQSKQITIDILNDFDVELQEDFSVVLSDLQGADGGTITADTGICYIDNDDLYQISIDDQTITEDGTATFTVSLHQAVLATQSVTVSYITTDDTAMAGSDYAGHGLTPLTFNPTEQTKTINVVIQTLKLGEEIITRYLKKYDLTINSQEFIDVIPKLGFKNLNNLILVLGRGEYTTENITKKL